VFKVRTNTAAYDNHIGLKDRNDRQEAAADTIGDIVPDTLAGDVTGVLAVGVVDLG
jgi:hypothetical protein